MGIFDFFKRKSNAPQAKGSYTDGHALGEGPEHPMYVSGVIANVNNATFTFGGDVNVSNVPLDVNVVSSGTPIDVTINGDVDVNLQDQTSIPLNISFMGNVSSVVLASNVTVDTRTCVFNGGHGITTSYILCFKEGDRHFQSRVINVNTNTITIDSPFDYGFTTGASVFKGVTSMNVDGGTTPVIFRVSPLSMDSSVQWDITKIIIHIEDDAAMDDTKFGGISALTNGVVMRKKDGTYVHFFNAKDNGALIDYCSIYDYSEKAGGGGYGFRVVKAFGGQDNQGVVIRLAASSSDELQIIVQDNLTTLTDMHATAIGHVVVP